MSVLRSLEDRIAGLVEGSFSRAFRSEVRPVEIARRLAREMDAHRTPYVSRVYVPFAYDVYLGEDDFSRFDGHERELVSELSTFLLEHARRERLVLAERPRIAIHLDERLGLGEFGIRTTEVDKSRIGAAPEAPSPAPARPPAPAPRVRPVAEGSRAALAVAGQRIELESSGMLIGRSRECDVVLQDPNASRRHARIFLGARGWTVEDLGSTNGVTVNGSRIPAATVLGPGDRIELGNTEMTLELG